MLSTKQVNYCSSHITPSLHLCCLGTISTFKRPFLSSPVIWTQILFLRGHCSCTLEGRSLRQMAAVDNRWLDKFPILPDFFVASFGGEWSIPVTLPWWSKLFYMWVAELIFLYLIGKANAKRERAKVKGCKTFFKKWPG